MSGPSEMAVRIVDMTPRDPSWRDKEALARAVDAFAADAAREEREACAKLCETIGGYVKLSGEPTGQKFADAIRARGAK